MPLNLLFNGKQGFTYSSKNYYLESMPPVPKLPFIDELKLKEFWGKKVRKQHETISMRLSILDNFYATK